MGALGLTNNKCLRRLLQGKLDFPNHYRSQEVLGDWEDQLAGHSKHPYLEFRMKDYYITRILIHICDKISGAAIRIACSNSARWFSGTTSRFRYNRSCKKPNKELFELHWWLEWIWLMYRAWENKDLIYGDAHNFTSDCPINNNFHGGFSKLPSEACDQLKSFILFRKL